jgi:Ni/Co efflux regulator RcnB
MRKVMLLLLLAGAATPAIAAAQPVEGSSDESQAERAERHQARQEARQVQVGAAEPSANGSDRPHFGRFSNESGQGPAAAQVEGNAGGGQQGQQFGRFADDGGQGAAAAAQVQGDNGAQTMEARRQHFGGSRQVQSSGGGQDMAVQPLGNDGAPSGESRSWGWRERRPMGRDQGVAEQQGGIIQDGGGSGSLRQLDRAPPYVMRNRVPVVSSVPREGTQPPRTGIYNDGHRMEWTGNWRNDRRYDWRDHRRHHRSLFHLGFYYDPFGWGYQPYSIGWRLWPSYYSSRYWLHDPYAYRLPYAPPGYRWIRYWDDALLVDTWTGEVVDVIRDFFW